MASGEGAWRGAGWEPTMEGKADSQSDGRSAGLAEWVMCSRRWLSNARLECRSDGAIAVVGEEGHTRGVLFAEAETSAGRSGAC